MPIKLVTLIEILQNETHTKDHVVTYLCNTFPFQSGPRKWNAFITTVLVMFLNLPLAKIQQNQKGMETN
jgi:hypothetical protein